MALEPIYEIKKSTISLQAAVFSKGNQRVGKKYWTKVTTRTFGASFCKATPEVKISDEFSDSYLNSQLLM